MGWKEKFYWAVADMLIAQGMDVKEITSIEDRTERRGHCSTCFYQQAVLDIIYIDSKSKQQSHTYNSGFGNLMYMLDDS